MKKMKPLWKKRLRWALRIAFIWAFLMTLVSFLALKQLKPILQEQIGHILEEATSNLYHIKFDEVHINPFTASVSLINVNLTADTLVYQQLLAQKKAPNNLYNIRLKELAVKKINPIKLYFDKRLEIDLLLFDKAVISMTNKVLSYNEEKLPESEKTAYEYVKTVFKAVHVKKIAFKNAGINYVDKNFEMPQTDTISNLFITMKDWLIDKNSAQDTSRFFLLKDIDIYLNNYVYATPDSMYYLKTNEFEYNSSTKLARIKLFELVPRYSEQDFAKHIGFAKDRYTLQLNNIDLKGLSLSAYLRKREVRANAMDISNGFLSVFNDRSYPKLADDKTGRFPHQLLQKLTIPLTIKQINLQNLDISYAEFNPKSQQRGHIDFNQTSGTIKNITNEVKQKNKNRYIDLDLQSFLMKQGKLNVKFRFDMLSPNAAFSYHGELGKMDATQLNYITRPLAMVHVKNCDIDKLVFDINADENAAKGTLDFTYQNLAVGLLKVNTENKQVERLGLLSLLANTVIINTNNPTKEGKHMIAPIYYERNKNGSFFHYLWRTIFKGVKHSIGFSEEREKEIKRYLKSLDQLKHDRENRKRNKRR